MYSFEGAAVMIVVPPLNAKARKHEDESESENMRRWNAFNGLRKRLNEQHIDGETKMIV
jgi:hypothetical protein